MTLCFCDTFKFPLNVRDTRVLLLLPDYQVSQDRSDRGDHLLCDLSDPAPRLWQAGIDLTFGSLSFYSLMLKTPPLK